MLTFETGHKKVVFRNVLILLDFFCWLRLLKKTELQFLIIQRAKLKLLMTQASEKFA